MKTILALSIALFSPALVAAQETTAETIRICVFSAPGFFTRDANGVATGLEYDLLNSFGTAEKRPVVFEERPLFDSVLRDTADAKCHIGAATITVTEERQAKLAFSTPYFPNRVVVVQKQSTAFAQPGDLKDRRVAVVKGTVSVEFVSAIPGAVRVPVDDDDAAVNAVLRGDADAFACDSAVVLYYLKKHSDLRIAFPLGPRSFFGFAFPPGSPLVSRLSEHLKSLSKSGAFRRMLAKHFGEDNAEMLAEDVAQAAAKP